MRLDIQQIEQLIYILIIGCNFITILQLKKQIKIQKKINKMLIVEIIKKSKNEEEIINLTIEE